jgi:hypothetical protein
MTLPLGVHHVDRAVAERLLRLDVGMIGVCCLKSRPSGLGHPSTRRHPIPVINSLIEHVPAPFNLVKTGSPDTDAAAASVKTPPSSRPEARERDTECFSINSSISRHFHRVIIIKQNSATALWSIRFTDRR